MATKEHEEHKDDPFIGLFYAIYAFFCGYPSGLNRSSADEQLNASGRQRRDGLPRFLAGPEGQVARHDVDDHRPQETDGRHPEERAVMHPLPARAVGRMLGTGGATTVGGVSRGSDRRSMPTM